MGVSVHLLVCIRKILAYVLLCHFLSWDKKGRIRCSGNKDTADDLGAEPENPEDGDGVRGLLQIL